ncbi:MAG: hypothetical protein IH624_06995 [Phycisphaerae bacterium]|nr:hypothetical protein [Phycisphaerae bacterium]
MKISDHVVTCNMARPYYYDFLCGYRTTDIPENIWHHIGRCDRCKTEVDRLNAAMDHQAGACRCDVDVAASTANLELHMALLGRSVDCNAVKPFLAPMVDLLFEVPGPTPVTEHIRECPACADDIETLRRLHLTHRQHCLLGQMLAETGRHDHETCRTARKAIGSVAAINFQDIAPAVLKHICLCADCRRLLVQERWTLAKSLQPQHTRNGCSCEDVTCGHLFDLCLPYGVDPAAEPPTEWSPSLLAHVSSCRRCMDKLQALLGALTHIMERPASGIVTCFTMADLSRARTAVASHITASVRPEHAPSADHSQPLESEKSCRQTARLYPHLRPFLKPAAAAAAVFLAAVLLLYGTSVKATDLSRVYAELAAVNTMHIKRFDGQRAEALQEIWICQNPKLKLYRTGDQYDLWDLEANARKLANATTGQHQTIPLDSETIAKVAGTLTGPMDILPFAKLSNAPEGATWHRLEDDVTDAGLQGTHIYEMTWTDKALGGEPVYCKWRGYVHPDTKRPLRTESYSRMDSTAEYTLNQYMEIAYPDGASIQALIKQLGL